MCSQLTSWKLPYVFFVATVLYGAQTALAQQADERFFLKTYEVGDLILNVQDYPYDESSQRQPTFSPGGGMGGGMRGAMGMEGEMSGRGGGYGGEGRSTARRAADTGAGHFPAFPSITIDRLVEVIIATVNHDSWAESGREGQIQSLGTALVVWQTEDVHANIEILLTQLRQGPGDRNTVTIDARWLLLNSDELDRLLDQDQEDGPQIDREVLAELTRRNTSIRGITNCISGQLVYLVSGTRRKIVSGHIPVVGSIELPDSGQRFASRRGSPPVRFVSDNSAPDRRDSGRVGYQPLVENPIFGALLEIRPSVIHGLAEAVVDLKSTITGPGEHSEKSMPAFGVFSGRAPRAPEVDRVAIETQELATTLRVRLNEPVLVGGLTYAPTHKDMRGKHSEEPTDQQSTTELSQLYLVLEVSRAR